MAYGAEIQPLSPDHFGSSLFRNLPRVNSSNRLESKSCFEQEYRGGGGGGGGGEIGKTDPTQRFVQCQSYSLDRDVPGRPIRMRLAERPEYTSGDEPSSANSDEQCWSCERQSGQGGLVLCFVREIQSEGEESMNLPNWSLICLAVDWMARWTSL